MGFEKEGKKQRKDLLNNGVKRGYNETKSYAGNSSSVKQQERKAGTQVHREKKTAGGRKKKDKN
jgi:hypothetical protein